MEAEVLGVGASTEAVPTSETFRVGPFDDPDRYEIGEPVEAGAEGILYRGRLVTPTSRLSLSVAVKALQPAYATRIDQWAARWRDQVELLRSLQIPGLVGVREGFVGPLPHREGAEVAGRNLYLVMNWVEGEALDHWALHHRGIDVRNALKLLLPVAVAVDTMHGGQLTGSVPVVHRDIKPANILIGPSGSVLVDFGLTKGLSIGSPVGRAGTPGYIAPEVVAGGGYTPAADRYAFGATVFFLLTRRHPPASAAPEVLRRLLESSSLGGLAGSGDIPAELVDRVVAMLDPDPLRRPAALANWIAQLRQSSLDDEIMTVRLAPPAPTRPRRGRRTGSSSRSSSRTTAGASGASATASTPRSALPAGPPPASLVAPPAVAGGVGMVGEAWLPPDPAWAPVASDKKKGVLTASIGGLTGTGGGADTATGGDAAAAPGTNDAAAAPGTNDAASGTAAAGAALPSSRAAVAPAHRRSGAHTAGAHRPQHSRHQRVLATRLGLAMLIVVALTVVGSDAGGSTPAGRRISIAGSAAPPVAKPADGVASPADIERGSEAPALAPAGDNSKTVAATTATTAIAGIAGASCFKSFNPSCGPLKWSPLTANQPLAFKVTFTPSSPVVGQVVTFDVVVTDPDDTGVQINGAFFGEQGGSAAAEAGSSSGITASASCATPYGAWPTPAPPAGAPGRLEQRIPYTYGKSGTYQVHFVASSGRSMTPCGLPDPYASTGQSSVVTVTVTVNPAPSPPPAATTTTSSTTPTTTPPPPPTTTTTIAATS